MRKYLTIVFSFVFVNIFAQFKEFEFKPYGFIRNDFYYDSRNNLESANGLFYMIPKDKKINELGVDENANPSSCFLSIASRLGVNISGPSILGSYASFAQIETDFAGFGSSTTMLRIRQAWLSLFYGKWVIKAGQTWHPMFGEVIPTVQSLATGSPFQPFNRSPQICVIYKHGRWNILGSALYQFQYTSVGPEGSSLNYQKNGLVPELYLGFKYKKFYRGNVFTIGAGVDYLHLKPRAVADLEDSEGNKYSKKVDEKINSFSANAFVQYTNDKNLAIKFKTIFGQNMSHLLLMSGYGVKKENSDGSYEYTNFNNSTSWLNVTYGKKYQVGIFAGYSKNLGSEDELLSEDKVYVMGYSNLDQVFRIAPQVSYNIKHWSFGVEYEMTQAAYGTLDLKDGKVKNTHNVTNNRVVAVMMYKF